MAAASDSLSVTSPAACSTSRPSRPRRGRADGRAKIRTFSPRATSLRTRLSPTKPVAPVTRFMRGRRPYHARASGDKRRGARAARLGSREDAFVEVYLDHLKGERSGALDRFGKEVIRVGRNAEFELCFDDLGVSYEHAELRLRDGDYWLVDRGSTNGSYVNEERAYNARLKDGDVLRFGKKGPVVRFRVGAANAAAANAKEPAAS